MPSHAAAHGTMYHSPDGLWWIQTGQGTAAFWELFSGCQSGRCDVVWSSDDTPLQALPTQQTFAWTSPNTATDDYATLFVLKRPMLVRALVVPLLTWTSGTLNVKAAIYQEAHDKTYWITKCPDPRLIFQLDGYDPTSKVEPTMIPPYDVDQEPVFLSAGRYWIRHIWGGNMTTTTLYHRTARDFGGSGTLQHFRGDRYRAAAVDYTVDALTTFAVEFSGTWGSSVASNIPARIDWGIYGEILI